jgi:hypothetical protein
VGFLDKFFARKGISVSKDGISYSTNSSRSWSQTFDGADPNALPPEVANLLKKFPQGITPDATMLVNRSLTQAGPQAGIGSAVDLAAFSMRALKVVDAVTLAWSRNDPKQAEPFVSSDFLKRWSFPGYWRPAKNRSTNLTVGGSTSQDGLDRIESEVKTMADGKSFHEVWTFVRGTSGEPGRPTEIRCPSCGAPFPHVQAGTCAFCGADVVPPPLEWVVDGIRPA